MELLLQLDCLSAAEKEIRGASNLDALRHAVTGLAGSQRREPREFAALFLPVIKLLGVAQNPGLGVRNRERRLVLERVPLELRATVEEKAKYFVEKWGKTWPWDSTIS